MPASGCFCGSATQHHFQLGRLQAHGPFCSRPLSCCYTGADSPAEVDAAQPLLKRGDAAAAGVIVERVLSGATAACSPTGCWTLLVLPLFCLFLVDNSGLLAFSALSFCDLRMGLLVRLWNHIFGLHLIVGHISPPVSGVNVANAGRFLLAA